VRARRPGIVDDRCVALHPDPPAIFGEEPVVLGRHLAFVEHCEDRSISTEIMKREKKNTHIPLRINLLVSFSN
jgi:hypothetical protein